MNAIRNQVQIIGNLGRNPEFKALDGGKHLATFTLATHHSYTNAKGDQVDDTQWHNIVAWGKTAERIDRLLAKGKEVLVKGKLTSRSYDDKEGNKRYITEVVASDFLLLSRETDKEATGFPF